MSTKIDNVREKKIRDKISSDPDFIHCPRLGNSLQKYMDRYPEGVDNEKIAKVLMMKEDEVEATFQNAVRKLRASIGVKDEDLDEEDDY